MYKCLAEKKKAVIKIKNIISTAKFYAVFKFTKFTVNEIENIRQELREINTTILVLKNTILKLSIADMGFCENITKKFHGQLFIIAAKKNEQLVSKKISTQLFHSKTILIHAVLDSQILTSEEIKTLSTIPDTQTVLNRLLYTLNKAIYLLTETTKTPIITLFLLFSSIEKKHKNGESVQVY